MWLTTPCLLFAYTVHTSLDVPRLTGEKLATNIECLPSPQYFSIKLSLSKHTKSIWKVSWGKINSHCLVKTTSTKFYILLIFMHTTAFGRWAGVRVMATDWERLFYQILIFCVSPCILMFRLAGPNDHCLGKLAFNLILLFYLSIPSYYKQTSLSIKSYFFSLIVAL